MPDNDIPDTPAKAAAPSLLKPEKPTNRPTFGPGSQLNWDDEKFDPNKRHHIGLDPEGKANLKESGLK
jgi:hypothetical protein